MVTNAVGTQGDVRGGDASLASRFEWPLLIAALAGAVTFRLYLLAALDFPVNDGALFLEFVEASASTFPYLPTSAAYNGLLLPFAYPPLAFWIGAAATKLGADSLSVIRIMPILVNILYVLLFALLLLKSGRSRLFTALTILFFAVNLRSFEWLLMGGGLTRGLGSLFLMLALLAVTVPDRGREGGLRLTRMVLAGAAVGAAILSHLEWGIVAASSVVLSCALRSVSLKQFILGCLTAGITALTLVVPWILIVIQAHGPDPFFAASGTSGWKLDHVAGRLVGIASMAVATNPLTILGGLMLLVKRQWFWVGFILICVILTPRHAQTPAMLAIAVFSAQGVISAVDLGGRVIRSKRLLLGGVAALVVALLAVNLYRSQLYAPHSFRVLPGEMRQAMAWVSVHQPNTRFAIVNDRPWPNDSSGEWFPTLAGARSITTVQGREWNGEYVRWDELTRVLRASETCGELHENLKPFGPSDFIWAETMQDCFRGSGYRPIFHNRLVTIYQVSGTS
jgi:hypothetical protein